jgi:hypothetical protein
MSAFRRLIGASPVEIRDNLDAFINYYNEHNIPYKQDLKRLSEGLMPGINNTNDLKEAHSLRKNVCYNRIKLIDTNNPWRHPNDPPPYTGKKVGKLQGAKLMSDVYSNGQKYFYWLVKFTNATVQWLPGDENIKWFEPCSETAGGQRKKTVNRKKNRKNRTRKQ